MDVIIVPFIKLVLTIINLYVWVVVASVVLSWLVAFGVVNTSNRFVYTIGDVIHRITEPLLRPIRNILPDMGNVDLSPVALIMLLWFSESMLIQLLLKF
ncbi:MAG: YggT family protein [Rhodospirillaceae bacterium]|nr:YggT family protein [Rhodospirillaceae bacterium]MDH5772428.1 YggT family protein [Rhodospirillaceae bacterium]